MIHPTPHDTATLITSRYRVEICLGGKSTLTRVVLGWVDTDGDTDGGVDGDTDGETAGDTDITGVSDLLGQDFFSIDRQIAALSDLDSLSRSTTLTSSPPYRR